MAPELFALALLWLASIATAAGKCVETGLCFSLSVPNATVQSGKGDIFFFLSGPTKYSWISLAQAWPEPFDAHFFTMYTSSDGKNVTLSSRAAKEFKGPIIDNDTKFVLLSGSGVADGIMTAVVKCSNCYSWAGASLITSVNHTDWIWAYAIGDPVLSDNKTLELSMYTKSGIVTIEAAQSSNSNETNPFASPPEPAPSPPSDPGAKDPPSPMTSDDLPSEATVHRPPVRVVRMYTAHAVLACFAWAFIFPLGGILIRLLSFPNLVWVHAGLQITGYVLYIAAVGLGVELSTNPRFWRMENKHVIIGLLIFALFFVQGFTGLLHHRIYKRVLRRQAVSYMHLWTGRICIVLGMLNAGFGFQITKKGVETWQVKTYIVFAVFMFVAYVSSVVVGERRRNRNLAAAETATVEVVRGMSDSSSGRFSPVTKEVVAATSEKAERKV